MIDITYSMLLQKRISI